MYVSSFFTFLAWDGYMDEYMSKKIRIFEDWEIFRISFHHIYFYTDATDFDSDSAVWLFFFLFSLGSGFLFYLVQNIERSSSFFYMKVYTRNISCYLIWGTTVDRHSIIYIFFLYFYRDDKSQESLFFGLLSLHINVSSSSFIYVYSRWSAWYPKAFLECFYRANERMEVFFRINRVNI